MKSVAMNWKRQLSHAKARPQDEGHPMEAAALNEAAKSVGSDLIPCLRISDRNTTGLFGEKLARFGQDARI